MKTVALYLYFSYSLYSDAAFCYASLDNRCPLETFKKYEIEKVEIFHVLTDTDSKSLNFMFISDPNRDTPEDKFKEIMFEVITASKIYKGFDS